MKFIAGLVTIFVSLSFAQASSECDAADTLFSGGKSYSCQLESGDPVCLKVGYHDTVQTDGFRIFETDENKIDQVDEMFFDERSFLKCKVTFFKACTHEEISITETSIKGYTYRAPDVWDARSSEKSFEYDFTKGYGELVLKSYNVDGSLKNQTTTAVHSCK